MLELLYTRFMDGITCANDALVCFVHWELIRGGYKCIGSGNEARSSEEKSELLPSDWSSNKDVYTLRYKPKGTDTLYVLKGVPIDSTLFLFSFMVVDKRNFWRNELVLNMIVNVNNLVDADQLQTYNSVYKDINGFSQKIWKQLLPDRDPLRIHKRHPAEVQTHCTLA